jgi:hypothetical protein
MPKPIGHNERRETMLHALSVEASNIGLETAQWPRPT